jgi:hypothetical protein
VVLLTILIADCSKIRHPVKTKKTTKTTVSKTSGEGVLLRYKFVRGRVLKYRTKTENKMRFTIPFITEPQQAKTASIVDIAEEVIQEPIGGYALVEQRCVGFRFIMYQGKDVVFDSARPKDFPPQPQFEELFNLKGTKVRYEISPTGEIRKAEGMEDLSKFMGPSNLSQIYQSSQPVLPDKAVSPGESWKSRREIPLTAAKGMTGGIIISDNVKLMEIRTVEKSRLAFIELNRKVEIHIKMPVDKKHKRKKQVIRGNGESTTTAVLDIERGIIIRSDGRIKVSTSAVVSDQPTQNRFTIEIDGIISNAIVEK